MVFTEAPIKKMLNNCWKIFLRIQHENLILKSIFLALVIVGLSGCASILTGDKQRIVLSVSCKGRELPTYCTVSNDKGQWSFLTPEILYVEKSRESLKISCRGLLGTTRWSINSSPSAAMVGNIVFGGVVGAVVDHNTARGYQYPESIDLESPICKYI
jgi:hypothetical protein